MKRFDKEIKDRKRDKDEEQLLKKIKSSNEHLPKTKKKYFRELEEWEEVENIPEEETQEDPTCCL